MSLFNELVKGNQKDITPKNRPTIFNSTGGVKWLTKHTLAR